MDEIFTGTPEETVRKEIFDVALAPHLVSKCTSLVAVDITPVRATGKSDPDKPQGANVMDNEEKTAMTGMPQTGTDGPFQLLLGLLLLASAAILLRVRRAMA